MSIVSTYTNCNPLVIFIKNVIAIFVFLPYRHTVLVENLFVVLSNSLILFCILLIEISVAVYSVDKIHVVAVDDSSSSLIPVSLQQTDFLSQSSLLLSDCLVIDCWINLSYKRFVRIFNLIYIRRCSAIVMLTICRRTIILDIILTSFKLIIQICIVLDDESTYIFACLIKYCLSIADVFQHCIVGSVISLQ